MLCCFTATLVNHQYFCTLRVYFTAADRETTRKHAVLPLQTQKFRNVAIFHIYSCRQFLQVWYENQLPLTRHTKHLHLLQMVQIYLIVFLFYLHELKPGRQDRHIDIDSFTCMLRYDRTLWTNPVTFRARV